MNHPYGYPIAIALLSIAAFFLIATYREIDELLETRRQRHLDQDAHYEDIKQRLTTIPNQQKGDTQ